MRSLVENDALLEPHIKQVLIACRDRIRAKYPTAKIVLFGSQARGTADLESDIDLLIVLDKNLVAQEKRTIHDTLYEIGLAEDLVISVIIRSHDEWNCPISQAMPLYRAVHEEGIIVA